MLKYKFCDKVMMMLLLIWNHAKCCVANAKPLHPRFNRGRGGGIFD